MLAQPQVDPEPALRQRAVGPGSSVGAGAVGDADVGRAQPGARVGTILEDAETQVAQGFAERGQRAADGGVDAAVVQGGATGAEGEIEGALEGEGDRLTIDAGVADRPDEIGDVGAQRLDRVERGGSPRRSAPRRRASIPRPSRVVWMRPAMSSKTSPTPPPRASGPASPSWARKSYPAPTAPERCCRPRFWSRRDRRWREPLGAPAARGRWRPRRARRWRRRRAGAYAWFPRDSNLKMERSRPCFLAAATTRLAIGVAVPHTFGFLHILEQPERASTVPLKATASSDPARRRVPAGRPRWFAVVLEIDPHPASPGAQRQMTGSTLRIPAPARIRRTTQHSVDRGGPLGRRLFAEEGQQFATRGHAQLGVDLGDVVLDRAHTEHE